MPRSLQEILNQADQLADRFESDDQTEPALKDASALRAVRAAFQAQADVESRVADAVLTARAEGHSWAAIGSMLGTSGEAARQRYGALGLTAPGAEVTGVRIRQVPPQRRHR